MPSISWALDLRQFPCGEYALSKDQDIFKSLCNRAVELGALEAELIDTKQVILDRGINQSGLLAGEFARKIKAPVSFDIIVRKKQTRPQTHLSRRDRLKNIKGAFEPARAQRVRGRRILLIDDVFTTGTTLNECARVLKNRGRASEVHAVTVTRALPG